ncbi:AAA family ATPase [Actinomadura madurae]|uniref:AAA family ATPase n=1 Tax=Actinomadura madurae TaxID=1993 RepID=UPI003FD7E77D|nr:AAA family ATPase [Actinomadura madurae]
MGDAARAAEAGRAAVALVGGDAGMGKTALAERFARGLAERGWTCAWGRAPETGERPRPGRGPSCCASWPPPRRPPPGRAERLGTLLDDAATGPGDADVSTGRFRLHLAVGDYLAGVAETAPLLLVLDDLHWADEETLALLVRLAGRLRDRPVLLLATFRQTEVPDGLAAALAALARHEPVRIELGGLSPAEVAVLVRGTCDTDLADAELAAIAERTGGNPFFTRETARLIDAEGLPAATRRVPAGVGDVLRRRIARLPGPARSVLRDAAVLGRDADLRVLSDLAGDEETVIDAVEAGLGSGLVTEPAPGRMRFAHALVRDTLYDGVSRARRRRAARPGRRRPRTARPRRGRRDRAPLPGGGHGPGQGRPVRAARRRGRRGPLRARRRGRPVGPRRGDPARPGAGGRPGPAGGGGRRDPLHRARRAGHGRAGPAARRHRRRPRLRRRPAALPDHRRLRHPDAVDEPRVRQPRRRRGGRHRRGARAAPAGRAGAARPAADHAGHGA